MPNDFYTRAYNPLPEQRVSSQVLKDEFARVEAGFDEVQSDADRAIKLPVGTADQTLAMDAGARANLVLAFDASGNITAISYGRFRGDWLTATAYVVSDYFRDPVSKNIYAVILGHTSGVLATDIAANRVQLAINVEDVETAKAAAEAAAATATTQAGLATTNGAAQVALAEAQAVSASASASTATAQAGIATTKASEASASAGTASTGASTATTQAGIATTKAGEASASAIAAAASAASIAGGPVPEAPSDGKTYGRKNAAWAEAAPLASPTFTGTPAATTAAVGTNTTQLATTAHVYAERAATATLTNKTLTTPLITGTREVLVAMPANAIDLATGNLFTKTISGATTLTVSNVPTTGTAASFILELTNAGSAAITWFSGVKWAGGTAPTLTASGVDVLGFYSHDGGTTWRGFLLSKDSK